MRNDIVSHISNDNIISKDKSREVIERTFDAPLISFRNITNNRTFYPAESIEAGLNSNITKTLLEGKKFYMEADHPDVEVEKRIRTKLNSPLAGCITEVWRNDEDGHFWGTVDLLNTESGSLVNKLLEYGSQLGISIRAEGDHTEMKDEHGVMYKNILPDNFVIYGFDIVILPSSQEAIIPVSSDEYYESMDEGSKKLLESDDGYLLKSLLFEGETMDNSSIYGDYDYTSPKLINDTTISSEDTDEIDRRETAALYEAFGTPSMPRKSSNLLENSTEVIGLSHKKSSPFTDKDEIDISSSGSEVVMESSDTDQEDIRDVVIEQLCSLLGLDEYVTDLLELSDILYEISYEEDITSSRDYDTMDDDIEDDDFITSSIPIKVTKKYKNSNSSSNNNLVKSNRVANISNRSSKVSVNISKESQSIQSTRLSTLGFKIMND